MSILKQRRSKKHMFVTSLVSKKLCKSFVIIIKKCKFPVDTHPQML
jgi:hypothetical protein